MKILVITEDFTRDQFIVQPLLQAMLKHLGKPHAQITVCKDKAIQGVDQALKRTTLQHIFQRYPMMDLFLLCIDRDGYQERQQSLKKLEDQAQKPLLTEAAREEVEVWALAGLELPSQWRWQEIRQEIHPKECYFQPLAKERRLANHPAGGYKQLGQQAAANYQRIRSLCPEDVGRLETRIQQWMNAPPP
ncbi:MAG: hypothetical protein G8345_06175 [Magnetococcales bacterium]|nr:hypothetical protein [Magnetococcales bacterium]NGZ26456.1 hypothetical protein [Magnetococcales bacterium]